MESIIEILDISSLAPLIIKKPPLDRMVKLKSLSEFKRFLSKEQANLTEYEKKLARLILDNFSSVESKGTAAGGRRAHVARLTPKLSQHHMDPPRAPALNFAIYKWTHHILQVQRARPHPATQKKWCAKGFVRLVCQSSKKNKLNVDQAYYLH